MNLFTPEEQAFIDAVKAKKARTRFSQEEINKYFTRMIAMVKAGMISPKVAQALLSEPHKITDEE